MFLSFQVLQDFKREKLRKNKRNFLFLMEWLLNIFNETYDIAKIKEKETAVFKTVLWREGIKCWSRLYSLQSY